MIRDAFNAGRHHEESKGQRILPKKWSTFESRTTCSISICLLQQDYHP